MQQAPVHLAEVTLHTGGMVVVEALVSPTATETRQVTADPSG